MRQRRRTTVPDAVESGLQQPSPWQQPPAWMAEVMERLLVMPEGHQLVRMASHVCHHWRAAAQEVLLADTAISKPPLEDFRAIGGLQTAAPDATKAHKADTVTTQAAVVLEATASTGMEAISKQRFDAPPSSVPGRGGGAAARRTRAAHPQPQARHDARLAARLGALRGQAAAAVQQQQQQQQRQVAPAAASPNRPLQGDRAVPQGSIQSGMAVTGRRGEGASDSDSEGSTRARGPTKHRRSQHRASGRDGSVEQPQRQPGLQHAAPAGLAGSALAARRASQAAAVLAAEEPAAVAAGVADAAGPSHPVSRGRKRSASAAAGEARPSKRQQRAQEQQPQGKQVEEQEAVVEQPQQRQKRQEPRRGTRTGLRSSGPAASAEQQQHPQQQQQQPAVAEAAGTAHPQQQQLQAKEAGGVVAAATVGVPAKPEGASEVSGSYHEAQAGSVEELEQSPEGQEVAQQLQRVAVAAGRRSREGQRQRDPLHAVVGFVKSLVWGPASSERLP